jgi:hypothetical protein
MRAARPSTTLCLTFASRPRHPAPVSKLKHLGAQIKAVASMVLVLASPAFGAPAYYEAFDFKSCLHWKINNEIHGDDLSQESKQYIAALELEKRQPYSWHKFMSAKVQTRMTEADSYKLVVVHSAYAYDSKTKKYFEKYGVCNNGIACLPNQDFPLAGASYKKIRSKGALTTLGCVAGCTDAPATIHDMGYENMDGERNIEQEANLEKFRKVCGRAP